MKNHKLNSVFLTLVNDGKLYPRLCRAAKGSCEFRANHAVIAVTATIRTLNNQGHNNETFTINEIFEIAIAVDEYHQRHLKENIAFAKVNLSSGTQK